MTPPKATLEFSIGGEFAEALRVGAESAAAALFDITDFKATASLRTTGGKVVLWDIEATGTLR